MVLSLKIDAFAFVQISHNINAFHVVSGMFGAFLKNLQ